MTPADAIRAHTTGVLRARAAYREIRAAEQPKASRGSAIGICERCGIDSKSLNNQKCPACKAYLFRKNRTPAKRVCVECAATHTEPAKTCNTCRVRKSRADAKERNAR